MAAGTDWKTDLVVAEQSRSEPFINNRIFPMDEHDAQRYRRQAEECGSEPAEASSPVEAASWPQLADDFEKLANARLNGRRATC